MSKGTKVDKNPIINAQKCQRLKNIHMKIWWGIAYDTICSTCSCTFPSSAQASCLYKRFNVFLLSIKHRLYSSPNTATYFWLITAKQTHEQIWLIIISYSAESGSLSGILSQSNQDVSINSWPIIYIASLCVLMLISFTDVCLLEIK